MGEQPEQLEDEMVHRNIERMKEQQQQKHGKRARKPRSSVPVQPQPSYDEEEEDLNYDQRPIMGSEPHDDNERLAEESKIRKEEQEQLRMYVLAALVRVARRVCWGYMRQLWDCDTECVGNESDDGVFKMWLQEDINREKQLCEVSE